VKKQNTTDFKVIVCGAILNSKNQILITRRKPQKILGGFWEFPGGKLEYGESLENALKREIIEELNMVITVDKLLHVKPHIYDHGAVLILFYLCHLKSGTMTLTDHDLHIWCAPHELTEHKLLPANEEVIEILMHLF